MTQQEIVATRFPTIGDIAKDPVFIEKATEYFEKKKHEREKSTGATCLTPSSTAEKSLFPPW